MGSEIGVKVNPGMLKPLKRGALFPLALKKFIHLKKKPTTRWNKWKKERQRDSHTPTQREKERMKMSIKMTLFKF